MSYLTGKPLADKAHISTSKTYSQQRDYRFDTKTFTELKNAQSITLAYDGLDPLPPTERGLLVSSSPKGPVRLGFPLTIVERWFPSLYPSNRI